MTHAYRIGGAAKVWGLWLYYLIALSIAPAASAGEYDVYRACVSESAAASVGESFHHCAGPLVAHCGASKTAKDAVGCIDQARFDMEAEIAREIEVLEAADPEAAASIEVLVANSRNGGLSACETMGHIDESQGVAVGQRAVNSAVCIFVASSDVYAMLLRLEPE